MNLFAGFSDWVLALLPRLFFAPGGVCLLLAFALHYTASHYRDSRGTASHNSNRTNPRQLLHAFLRENTPALASAWTATALVPLVGIAPLPFPMDTFSLLSLPILSLAFDVSVGNKKDVDEIGEIVGVLAITVAVLSPALSGKRLLLTGHGDGNPSWVVLGAIVVGLVALTPSAGLGINVAMRWLALGLTGLTLAASFNLGQVTALLAGCFTVGLIVAKLGWSKTALVTACLLAAFALLIQLLLR